MQSRFLSVNGVLAVFFIIAILALPVLFVHPVSAAYIFEDGFETGDFSKWSLVGGNPQVTSGDAHHGTYKAELSSTSQWAQARYTLTPVDRCFMRAYVMFKSFPTSGAETTVLGVFNWASGRYMAEARVFNDFGVMKWRMRYYHNGMHYIVTSELQNPVLNTWYCVEVDGKSNSATNSEARLYINGNELTDISQTGRNNDLQITCGYIWASSAVARWYDCVIIDADYIGPECTLTIDIASTLNLRSRGRWITCYIEFSEGYNPADIDVSTIMLNETIGVEPSLFDFGDYDNDSIPDLMVKFDRAEVQSYILANVDVEMLLEQEPLYVILTVTGELNDGSQFEGKDTIRVILPLGRQLLNYFETLEMP